MKKFQKYVRVRKFPYGGKYDYRLYIGPRTFLEPIGFLTKKEATKRGQELAKELGIEFKGK